MLKSVLLAVPALFPVSEIALAVVKRSRGQGAGDQDKGSWRLLWICIALGIGLAIAALRVHAARLPGPPDAYRATALALLAGGLALRWAAILTLGRLFTVDVAIQAGHAVVKSGLYRRMRHPSYTGLILAFLGLGLSFMNWLSFLALLVPILAAVVNRVVKEERALTAALGTAYTDYCASTKRFIPGLL